MKQLTTSRRSLLKGAAATGFFVTMSPGSLFANSDSTLRFGIVGSSVDSLDPHHTKGQACDIIRFSNLFDGLTQFDSDGNVEMGLATAFEPNADATEWTVSLVKGAKLHNNRDFKASDVVYSVKRILNKENPGVGSSQINFIDPEKVSAVDDTTVRFKLDSPYGPFAELWADRYLRMVPEDFDPANPVGTGAYRYVSFTPGRESVFEAFDDHFRGAPSIKRVVISDVSDPAGQMNGLRAGQLDVAYNLSRAEARIVEGDSAMALLNNPTNMNMPIFMRADQPPFNDPKVRMAFRLIVDREHMIRVALSGYGEVGNDMMSRNGGLGCGPTDVPQRTQDIEQAKHLLAEAGVSDLSVQMAAPNGTVGLLEAAQVFAEHAKLAGVQVEVLNLDPSSFLAKYRQWNFGVDFLSGTYLGVAKRALMSGGNFNTSNWSDPEFESLFKQAIEAPGATDRCSAINAMRTIEHERGANIVWGFANVLNACSNRIVGLKPYVQDSIFQNIRLLSLA